MDTSAIDCIEVHVCVGTAGVASGAFDVISAFNEEFENVD